MVLLALSLDAAACGQHAPAASHQDQPPIDVQTVTVTRSTLPDLFEAGGVVRARTTATVTSRIMAPVVSVLVTAGDRVRAGQTLARLDDRELSAGARRAASSRTAAGQASRAAGAEREAARAALTLASATSARITRLHQRKSATDSELDQATAELHEAEARVAAAEARVEEAAASLAAAASAAEAANVTASWATIVAPFGGVITEKLIEAGNMATPGAPLFRIEQSGPLRLDVRVDETRAAYLRSGDEAEVVFDDASAIRAEPAVEGVADRGAHGPTITTGRIAEIARALEAGTHAYLVKIDLPSPIVVPSGTFARARLAGPRREVLTVPRPAVVRNGQLASVFVADGDRARLRLVSLGRERGDLVEVLSGVDERDRIVREVPSGLSDGRRIRAIAAADRSTRPPPRPPSLTDGSR